MTKKQSQKQEMASVPKGLAHSAMAPRPLILMPVELGGSHATDNIQAWGEDRESQGIGKSSTEMVGAGNNHDTVPNPNQPHMQSSGEKT